MKYSQSISIEVWCESWRSLSHTDGVSGRRTATKLSIC